MGCTCTLPLAEDLSHLGKRGGKLLTINSQLLSLLSPRIVLQL